MAFSPRSLLRGASFFLTTGGEHVQAEEKKDQDIQPDLGAYKEEILPVNKSRLTWQRDLYFLEQPSAGMKWSST